MTLLLIKQNFIKKDQKQKYVKKDQREKVYKFDKIFFDKLTNEALYREIFPDLISSFLTGNNHTIMLMGPKKSGKSYSTIGNLRDPGLLLVILQDIFNFIEDKFLEDNITIKLSFFQYNQQIGFRFSFLKQKRDLLVENNFQFQPISGWNNQHQLLGVPEIILDNFLLALKIMRIAFANLNSLEQNLESAHFQQLLKQSALIFELKAEISPTNDLREQVIISKIKLVKMGSENFSMSFNESNLNLFRMLAEISQKTKKEFVLPFKQNELLDYLRDFLLDTSQVTMICCINNDYQETLKQLFIYCNQKLSQRIGSFAKQILNSTKFLSFSIYGQNSQLKEQTEHLKESINLFQKEFNNFEPSKQERGKQIFQIVMELQNFINTILNQLEQISELKYNINALYSQIISFHCSKYNNLITDEDLKEFYMAKVDLYAIEQVKQFSEQTRPILEQQLVELYGKTIELANIKLQLNKYMKVDYNLY